MSLGPFHPLARAFRAPGALCRRFCAFHAEAGSLGSVSTGSTSSSGLPAACAGSHEEAAKGHSFVPFRERRIAQGTQRKEERERRTRPRERELRLATKEIFALGRQRRWQEALIIYNSLPKPDVILSTAAMDACAKSLQLHQVRRIFSAMPVKTIPAYNVMMLLLAKLRLEHEAAELMEEMRGQSLTPDEATYCSLMTAYGVAQDADSAIRVLDDMHAAGITPSAPSYGAAMTACGRAADVARAKELMVRMASHSVEPDAGHFCSLITAHARAGDAEGARGALDQMSQQGHRPSVVTYTSLLAGLAGPGSLARAEEVFELMRHESIKPDTLAYNTLLGAAVESRAPERFWQILEEMDASGVPRNEHTEQRVADCQARAQLRAAAESPLPPGWHGTLDPASGRTYYWAEGDPAGTTTWVRPV